GSVTLRDLGSTNGSFVDAQRVTSTTLTNGSCITIGRTRIVFRQDSA
ncbi:MAG: FHA domain-containing protein, partial [Angustibacter sp.]